MELDKIPLLIEGVDISRYRAAERKIRHVVNGASAELVAMVINFAHSRDLGGDSALIWRTLRRAWSGFATIIKKRESNLWPYRRSAVDSVGWNGGRSVQCYVNTFQL